MATKNLISNNSNSIIDDSSAPLVINNDIIHHDDRMLKNEAFEPISYSTSQVRQMKTPSLWLVHLALIFCQTCFGGGSVIGKLGLHNTVKPIIFALIREAITGPILLILSYFLEKEGFSYCYSNLRFFWWKLILTGIFLYGNQLFFILGLDFSTATNASLWQPSQPIITTILCICIGWETFSVIKLLGILLSVSGAVFIISYGSSINFDEKYFLACFFLFLNCLCTSLYVIVTKTILKYLPPLTITAYSYFFASISMTFTSMYYIYEPEVWNIPLITWYALLYWIFFSSILAYFLLTWANQYADASIVMIYVTLQPLVAGILSIIILGQLPTYNDFGGIPILIGLIIVAFEKKIEHFFSTFSFSFFNSKKSQQLLSKEKNEYIKVENHFHEI